MLDIKIEYKDKEVCFCNVPAKTKKAIENILRAYETGSGCMSYEVSKEI